MNTIRSGKIARMPSAIREQLNQRLANHESSTTLLIWLNALPEVQALMTQDFGGKAIDRHNLHEWRHGGHAEWRRNREAREILEGLHADSNEMTKMAGGSVVNLTAEWVAAQYVVRLKEQMGRNGGTVAWEQMRACTRDILALQRGEQRKRRLELAQVALDLRKAEGWRIENGGWKKYSNPGGKPCLAGSSPCPWTERWWNEHLAPALSPFGPCPRQTRRGRNVWRRLGKMWRLGSWGRRSCLLHDAMNITATIPHHFRSPIFGVLLTSKSHGV